MLELGQRRNTTSIDRRPQPTTVNPALVARMETSILYDANYANVDAARVH